MIKGIILALTLLLNGQYLPMGSRPITSAEPTFTEVQSAQSGSVSAGTTVTVTLGSAPTAGNAVLCSAFYFPHALTISSIKDGAGTPNIYTVTSHTPSGQNAGAVDVGLAYLINVPAGASAAITMTMSTIITFGTSIRCTEFHRSSGTWTFDTDVAGTSTTASTTASNPSITPSVTGELLYAAAAGSSSAGVTGASPWTTDPAGQDSGTGVNAEYILAGASGATAINFTLSSSVTYNSMAMAVK